MLSFLPKSILGILAILLFLINLMITSILVIFFGILKLIPFRAWQQLCTKIQNDFLPSLWVDVNRVILKLTTKMTWDIKGQGNLQRDHWYFVISNHQSWADIIIIQILFNRKIPMLKFFIKQELLWMLPFGGVACWMLGFPFMKRYSKTQLKKNPSLKEKDLETTRAACEKFKLRPVSVINYLEGTRFTALKQEQRSSPYQNLLRPKSGGFAFVISSLKDYLHEMINVTLVYDYPSPSLWDFITGKVKHVTVHYQVVPIPEDKYGDYYHDMEFRKSFQSWVNSLWKDKDIEITKILNEKINEVKHSANCYP